MTRTVRRSDGLAVAIIVALLTARPPDRLTAQEGIASLPGSTRSAALAGAGVALVGDAASMFANPAAIATIHRFALEGSYDRNRTGVTLSSAAAAVRVGHYDFGVAGQMLRPAPGTAQPTDVLALSSLVFRFGMIALGGSIKYVRQGAATPQVEAWVGDAGIAIALFDIFALGASVQNLGGHVVAGTSVPRRTRFGLTMNYVDPQGSFRLITTVEGQWQEARSAVIVAGAEAGFVTHGIGLIARLGVGGQSAPSDLSPIALGAGVALGRLELDYAYRAYDTPSGALHRIGLKWGR